jgi:disulfide bond formation protein DsbB
LVEYYSLWVQFILRSFSKYASLVLIFLSASALILAYIFEYLLELTPCNFCVYERLPYFGLIVLNVLALCRTSIRKWTGWASLSILVISLSLGGIHVLTEWGILKEKCSGVRHLESTEAFLKGLESASASCSAPNLLLFKLSMAEWYLILSIFLTGVVIIGLRYGKKETD